MDEPTREIIAFKLRLYCGLELGNNKSKCIEDEDADDEESVSKFTITTILSLETWSNLSC